MTASSTPWGGRRYGIQESPSKSSTRVTFPASGRKSEVLTGVRWGWFRRERAPNWMARSRELGGETYS